VLYLAVAPARDLGCRAAVAQVLADRIAVVAYVGQHGAWIAIALLHQPVVSRHVMGFAPTEYDPDGETCGVTTQMDLGTEPTARTTECLILLLGLFAGGAAMRSDDGAIDHLQHVQCAVAVSQRLKQKVPDARLAQRRHCFHPEFHLPNTAGKSRHGAPVRQIQSMPSNLCRWFLGGRPPSEQGGSQQGREDRPL